MSVQRVLCADARQNEQQRHEPRIEDVHQHILVLRTVAETAHATENALVVVKVDDVVQQH